MSVASASPSLPVRGTCSLLVVLLAAGSSLAANAQHTGHPLPRLPTGGAAADAGVFQQRMSDDMGAMMRAMHAAPMTGNADIDFAAMMIPHHQGAIEMARMQLEFGTDPVMRRLAQEIIVTQQSEIELMRKRIGELQRRSGEKP